MDIALFAEDITNEVPLGDLAVLPILELAETVGTNLDKKAERESERLL